jgi:hypothetical protein
MKRRYFIAFATLTLALTLAGCTLLGAGSDGTLIYNGPTEQTVPMGASLPGADIRYVGYSDAGAEVIIGDLRAVKKPGDSLDWQGTPAQGVDVVLSQRVLAASAERLQTVGTVKVTVQGVSPAPAAFPAGLPLSYKVAVTYNVAKGARAPGTQIVYKGKTDQGAEFSGAGEYPYRKLGDSITWTGRLRANVYLDTTLRVIAYSDSFVQVVGLATLGLTQ